MDKNILRKKLFALLSILFACGVQAQQGNILAVGMDDGSICIVNANSGELLHVLEAHEDQGDEGQGASLVTWNPKGTYLVLGAKKRGYFGSGIIKIWDTLDPNPKN